MSASRAAKASGIGLWPLPMPVAIAVLCYFISFPINRGFTHWFHLMAVLCVMTRSEFLEKFQALIGTSICIGWYAAISYDLYKYGNFFSILYRNMPSSLTDMMLKDDKVDYESWDSIRTMALSHFLDTLGHPLLTYYFWHRHKNHNGGTVQSLLSWDVVVATWLFSRIWSWAHSYHNFGEFHMFYMGYDVYSIDHGTLDLWYPAYTTESLLYFGITSWKLSKLWTTSTTS